MALRNYTQFDLIRFRNFAKENKDLKPVELIKGYNKKYPELTSKQKLANLSKALGMDNLHKAVTGENIPESERWETLTEGESALPIPDVISSKATKHELKTWKPYYEAVVRGEKNFEVRKNDRDYKEGDILHLREWDNDKQEYTGRNIEKRVQYLLTGGAFGVYEGYVVMGLYCL